MTENSWTTVFIYSLMILLPESSGLPCNKKDSKKLSNFPNSKQEK